MKDVKKVDLQTMLQGLIHLVQSDDSLFSDWEPFDEEWARAELGLELSKEDIHVISLWMRIAACAAFVPIPMLWRKAGVSTPEGFSVDRFDYLYQAITHEVVDQLQADRTADQNPRMRRKRLRRLQQSAAVFPRFNEIHDELFALCGELGTADAVTDQELSDREGGAARSIQVT